MKIISAQFAFDSLTGLYYAKLARPPLIVTDVINTGKRKKVDYIPVLPANRSKNLKK